jgi:hypothetical protein
VPAAKQRSIPLYFPAFSTAPSFLNSRYRFLHHFSPRQDFQIAAGQYVSSFAISRALYWTQTSNLSEVYRNFIKETKRKFKRKNLGFPFLGVSGTCRAQIFKTFLGTETLPTLPDRYSRGGFRLLSLKREGKYSRVSSHHAKTSAESADSLRSIPPHTYILFFRLPYAWVYFHFICRFSLFLFASFTAG